MKRSILLGLALLAGGCGGTKPEVPVAPPSVTQSSGSSSDAADSAKPATVPPAVTSTESKTAVKSAPPSETPQPPASNELRSLAARLVEKSPQGAWRISESAALELEKHGEAATSALVALLRDPQAEVRRGAAYYLLANFNPGDEKQVAGYSALLEDSEPFLRSLGLQAVKKMHRPDQVACVPRLAKMLDPQQEASAENRATLARLLGSLKGDAQETLTKLLVAARQDESPKVRSVCLIALSQIAAPSECLPAFQAGLADTDASVRLVAAARLRQLGKGAAPASSELAQSLEDADPRVREAAAEALVMIGKEAVDPICQHLESKTAATRQLAIACLGKMGADARQALPLVEKRLADEDTEVKKVAEAVVMILKGG